MDKRGKGFRRETFYSICSKHQEPKHFCDCCNIGHWENDIRHAISKFFEKRAYPLWKWWHNRPSYKERLLNFDSRWK